MEGTRFRAEGLGGAFFAPAREEAPVAVNLPGLPARIHATPIVPTLLELGYAVVQPQYFGTYDSEGDLVPESAYRTVRVLLELLERGGLVDGWSHEPLLPPGRRVPLLVAHSFGTYVAMCALVDGLDFERVALFSPMPRFGRHSREDGLILDLDRHAQRIASVYPLTHRARGSDSLKRFFLDADDTWPTRRRPESGPSPTVGVFVGADDPGIDAGRAMAATRSLAESLLGVGCVSVDKVIPHGQHGVDTLLAHDTAGVIRRFLSGA
jgi:hypothetical protein